jgi:hypothetical protein
MVWLRDSPVLETRARRIRVQRETIIRVSILLGASGRGDAGYVLRREHVDRRSGNGRRQVRVRGDEPEPSVRALKTSAAAIS